ncbi:SWI/SNF complex protein [Emericellopsis atlantica]|uniref:SWI/SNF complex protein n=1 Tax=Emericellopsis atlantica TaxID=2614577 RepID=A0A9P7ZTU3_9HYPO|nr:SWI/SNF complex protein [Emericellopsis atlantica]KAG9257657.1 SWI/SNF complex protein [Emericellopsis atlantica]
MQQQYRAFAQQQQLPPRQSQPQQQQQQQQQRRGGIGPMMSAGPHPQVPLTQAQLQQQQQQAAQANDMAKRRSKKPTDKTLPDGVADCIIDPEPVQRYKDLRNVERRLDATMTRKRMDVMDSVSRPTKSTKTMRIWISNTVEDQVWQGNGLNVDAFDFSPNMDATYRVKIEGRLLDDDEDAQDGEMGGQERDADGNKMDEDGPGAQKKTPTKPKPRFSHFFKAMNIEFDPSRYRNSNEQSIEWKKPDPPAPRNQHPVALPAAADFDDISFKRSGDENVNITISLQRHETPERYKLKPELAEVLDMTEATQHEAVMGLWEYIRMARLQDDDEKRNFRCDDLLRKVVCRDTGHVPLLGEYIVPHLVPLPPIQLEYTIRVDEEFHKDPKPTVYDIPVTVEDPLRAVLQPFLTNPQYVTMLKEVNGLDDQLARLVQAVSVSKAKHTFFTALSEDPANFIINWMSSQKRDLDIVMGETSRGGGDRIHSDEWRRGGSNSVWTTQNARESVNVLLSKQPRV